MCYSLYMSVTAGHSPDFTAQFIHKSKNKNTLISNNNKSNITNVGMPQLVLICTKCDPP